LAIYILISEREREKERERERERERNKDILFIFSKKQNFSRNEFELKFCNIDFDAILV